MARKMDIDRSVHDFQFTRNWFRNRNLSTFRDYVYPEWTGKPIVYLELGVFEGMSMIWMLQHVLTHPESRAVGIDPWLMMRKWSEERITGVMNRAFHNTEPWRGGIKDNCQLIRGNSAHVLRTMLSRPFAGIKKKTVDLCMVDGNHNKFAVMDDLQLVYQLVKPGGWIICDDVENRVTKKDHVKHGLKMFLDETPMERVWKDKFCECYLR